jgi:hypothetical protein
LIALERVEPNRRPKLGPGELQQPRPDTPPDPGRTQIQLLDPAAVGGARDGHEPDDLTVDDGDRGPSSGNQTLANPAPDTLVGVSQRRARHELFARAKVDIGDRGGVTEGG